LRDPLTWQIEGAVSPDPEERAQAMVRFQAEKITQSLTVMTPQFEKIAVQNFLDLLRCMGDKPCAFTGNKQEPILKRLTFSRRVCDEIYIQVMKQLTDNPSTDSTAKGWDLLKKMVKEALPSAEVNEFLRVFVSREAELIKSSSANTEEFSKKDLRRALLDSARKQLGELKMRNQLQAGAEQGAQKRLSMADVTQQAVKRAYFADDVEVEQEKMDGKQGGGANSLAPRDGMGQAHSDRTMMRRKSRAAEAEMRQDNIAVKRKSFAAKQVVIAQEVQSLLQGSAR